MGQFIDCIDSFNNFMKLITLFLSPWKQFKKVLILLQISLLYIFSFGIKFLSSILLINLSTELYSWSSFNLLYCIENWGSKYLHRLRRIWELSNSKRVMQTVSSVSISIIFFKCFSFSLFSSDEDESNCW